MIEALYTLTETEKDLKNPRPDLWDELDKLKEKIKNNKNRAFGDFNVPKIFKGFKNPKIFETPYAIALLEDNGQDDNEINFKFSIWNIKTESLITHQDVFFKTEKSYQDFVISLILWLKNQKFFKTQ